MQQYNFTEIKTTDNERGTQEFVCVTVANLVNITLNVVVKKDGGRFCSLPCRKFGEVYDPLVYLLDRAAEKALMDAAIKWYNQQKEMRSVDVAESPRAAYKPVEEIPF